MRVNIDDDNENWRKWGALVQSWIQNTIQRPTTTAELKKQMTDNGIAGNVPNSDNPRPVEFIDYPNNGVLYIPLPSPEMLAAKRATVTPGPYPLPGFYSVAFGGAGKANLTASESDAFVLRRIGEYTINECC